MAESTAQKKNQTPTAPAGSWAEQVGTIVHVAPTSLLLVRNVRDARPDKGLIDSIREVGVLEPITALVSVPNADTQEVTDGEAVEALVVRFGHRRTLAAVEAGRDTVPVYLVGTTDATALQGEEDAESGVARVIAQHDENTHRAGLSTAENVGVVGQLAAFGLSANQIAKRSRIKRDQVDAALTVANSPLASGAAERWDDMTLDQLAVIAEFEDETEAVTALRAAAQTGRFAHVAQRLRDDRAREQARQEVLSPIANPAEGPGVTVIDKPAWNERTTLALTALRLDPHDEPGTTTTHADGPVAAHAGCPGHVAWADEEYVTVDADGNEFDEDDEPADDGTPESAEAIEAWNQRWDTATSIQRWMVVYGCRDWQNHGHVGLWQQVSNGDSTSLPGAGLSPDETATADAARERAATEEAEAGAKRAQRRLVIENNKAWDAAQTVRRDWIKTHLAARKTLPKGGAAYLLTAVARDGHRLVDRDADTLAAEWIDKKPEADHYGAQRAVETAADGSTDNRALMLALLHALAAIEADVDRTTWRRNNTAKHDSYGHGRYLRFLADCGYTLSDVEKYAISSKTA